MAEIINDEEIRAVEELTKEFNKLGSTIDQIIAKGKENQTTIEQSKSVKELTDKIDKLDKQQKGLTDTNKKLKDAQDKTTKSTHDSSESMAALDKHTGGFIERAKEMGKQLLALAKNPFFLVIAAVVAVLAAATSAVKTFFDATGEGEDTLSRQKAVWNQFFDVVKNGWKELGKSIVGANTSGDFSIKIINGMLNAAKFAFPPLIGWLSKIQAEFNKTAKEASDLADIMDDIDTRSSINIVKRAETERDYNEYLLEADKLKYTNSVKAVELLEKGLAKKKEQLGIDKAIAELNAEAVIREIGLKHNLTIEQVKSMNFAQRDAEFKGEEMKKIAEAYAAVIDLDAKFAQESKRAENKLASFREEIRKDQVDKAKKAAQEEYNILKTNYDNQIALIETQAAKGLIKYDVAEKQKYMVAVSSAESIADAQINALKKTLGIEQLTTEEKEALEKELQALKIKLSHEYFQLMKDGNAVEVEATKLKFDDIVDVYVNGTNAVADLFHSLSDTRLQQIDMEQRRMEERYAKEIELAGDNEETKKILEKEAEKRREEFEKKRIAAQRKAAIFDKALSATQASIKTAQAVIGMLGSPPYGPVAVGLSIAAGITGALEVAAILAKPIPQYKDGGTTLSEWIIAGEEGIEKFRTPGGQIGYTPGRPTLMRMPVGTEITAHDETVRGLAADAIDNVGGSYGTIDDIGALVNKLDSVENTIRNKREVHFNWTRKGIERAIKNGEGRTYFLNEFYA